MQCSGALPCEYGHSHTDDLENIMESEVPKKGVLGMVLPLSAFQINLWVDRSLTFGVHSWM